MADASRKPGAFDIMVKQLVVVFMGLLALLLALIIAGAIGDRYYGAQAIQRKVELDKQEAFANGMSYADYVRMQEAEQEKAEGAASQSSPQTTPAQGSGTPAAQPTQPGQQAPNTSAAGTSPSSFTNMQEGQKPSEPPLAKGQMILPKPDLTVTPEEIAEMKNKAAVIYTTLGSIPVTLYAEGAPQTVKNFIYLARNGFYNGLSFHRMVPGGMVEAGSPNARRGGTAGYWFPMEPSQMNASVGTLAMLCAPETQMVCSEFAIFTADGGAYADQTTVFGRVLDRFDVAQKVADAVCDRDGYIEDRVYITKVDIVDKSTVTPEKNIWEDYDRQNAPLMGLEAAK